MRWSFIVWTRHVVRTRLAEPAEDCGVLQAVLASACTGDPGHPDHWPRYAALAEHVIQLDRLSPTRLPRSRENCRVVESGGPFPSIPLSSVYGCRSLAPKGARHREQAVGRFTPGHSREHEQPRLDASGAGRSGRSWRSAGISGSGCWRVVARRWASRIPTRSRAWVTLPRRCTRRAILERLGRCQERVLEGCRRVSGEEHPDTLTSMNNLAVTFHAQGDLRGARALQERVLEARRRVLGEEHPDTLMSMNNLVPTLHAQGDLRGARELQERVFGDPTSGVGRGAPGHSHEHEQPCG